MSSNSELLAFLQREKNSARERIRQCQIFLQDEPLLESEAATRGTLRESLEQIRANAEEDFGSFLHLLTVIKPAKTAPKVDVPSPIRGVAAEEEKRAQSPFVSEDELDPCTMFEHGQSQLTNLVMNAERGEVNGHGEKDSEELAEEDDYVPNLPPSAVNATSAGVARTSGRFVHRPVPTAATSSSDSPSSGYARSLPVTVPITERMLTRDMLPPELREEDMTPPEDILSSIQNIAKSLHREPFSVEQPRAQRARIFSGAE